MSSFDELRRRVIERALEGPGISTAAARRAAFDNRGVDARLAPLVETVATRAWRTVDADITAPVAAGVSEDEVFESVVCAALGQADRQLEAALGAVAAAFGPRAEERP
jgi:hypothetical protein